MIYHHVSPFDPSVIVMPKLDSKQFGNKAAGLSELEISLANMPGFSVPEFNSISHAMILAFLQQYDPLIESNWLMQSAEVTENWETLLQTTCDKIIGILKAHADELYQLLISHCPLLSNNPNECISIRSTGNEDGEFINSGGHESAIWVEKNKEAIITAVCKVIASYLSKKSVQQRQLRNKNAFAESLFLPIIIQKMVGSTQDVISGNLLTCEPDAFTENVTQINAGFGLMAGTNAALSTDTFYVDGYGLVIPACVNKKQGYFVNQETRLLELRVITPERNTAPCLSRTMLLELKKLAQHLQTQYGKPVLIEFLIENQHVYVLQVNQVSLDKKTQPSYLTNDFYALKNQTFSIKSLAISNSVVILNNGNHLVIYASDVETALTQYLQAPQGVNTIILEHPCSPLCHALLTFRVLKINVLILSNSRDLISPETPFALDTQRKRLTIIPAGFDVASFIRLGFIDHPISTTLSLDLTSLNADITPTLPQLSNTDNRFTSWPALLAAFREGPDLRKAFFAAQRIMIRVLYQQNRVLKSDRNFIKLAKTIFLYLAWLEQNIDKLMHQSELVRAYYAHWLDELMRQHLNPFHRAIKQETQLIALHSLADEKSSRILQLLKLEQFIFKQPTQKKWVNFCKAISVYPRKVTDLTKLVVSQIQQKTIFGWLNTIFHSTCLRGEGLAIFDSLVSILESQKIILNNIISCDRLLEQLQSPALDKNTVDAGAQLVQVIDQTIMPSYKDAADFGKVLYLLLLQRLVETFDEVMKNHKTTINLSDKNACQLLAELLNYFFEFLKVLIKHAGLKPKEDRLSFLKPYPPYSYESMLPSQRFSVPIHIVSTYEYVKNMQMEDRLYPVSFEDKFSAIHQHCLYVVNQIASGCDIKMALPDTIEELRKIIERVSQSLAIDHHSHGAQHAIGNLIEYKMDNIVMSYLFPLRHHGINVAFNYDIPQRVLRVEWVTYAKDEDQRNARMNYFMHLYCSTIDNFTLIASKADDEKYVCKGYLQSDGNTQSYKLQIKKICYVIRLLADITFYKRKNELPYLNNQLFSEIQTHAQRSQLALRVVQQCIVNKMTSFLLTKAISYVGMMSKAIPLLQQCIDTISFSLNEEQDLLVILLIQIHGSRVVLPPFLIQRLLTHYNSGPVSNDNLNWLYRYIVAMSALQNKNYFEQSDIEQVWEQINSDDMYDSYGINPLLKKLRNELIHHKRWHSDKYDLIKLPDLTSLYSKEIESYEQFPYPHWRYLLLAPRCSLDVKIKLLSNLLDWLLKQGPETNNRHVFEFLLSELQELLSHDENKHNEMFKLLAKLMQTITYPVFTDRFEEYYLVQPALAHFLTIGNFGVSAIVTTPVINPSWQECDIDSVKETLLQLQHYILINYLKPTDAQDLLKLPFDELLNTCLSSSRPLWFKVRTLQLMATNIAIRWWLVTDTPELTRMILKATIDLMDVIKHSKVEEIQTNYVDLLLSFIHPPIEQLSQDLIQGTDVKKKRLTAFREDIQAVAFNCLMQLFLYKKELILICLHPLKSLLHDEQHSLTHEQLENYIMRLTKQSPQLVPSALDGCCAKLKNSRDFLVQSYRDRALAHQQQANKYLDLCLLLLRTPELDIQQAQLEKIKNLCSELLKAKIGYTNAADGYIRECIKNFKLYVETPIANLLIECNQKLSLLLLAENEIQHPNKRARVEVR